MKPNNHEPVFLAMIEANKGIIYKIANAYCKNATNRMDLIQEIILQLWLSIHKYNEKFRQSTWIYRIALNVAISFYRKENRRIEINNPFPEETIYLEEEPATDYLNEDIDQLYVFIRALKEIDRAIMLLFLEGSSQTEIADILGLTPTNISTKILRIKQQLQQKFTNLKN